MISFDKDSVDTVTNEPVVNDHVHEELHEGNKFSGSEYVNITSGTSRYYKFVTGAKEAHFLCKVNVDAGVQYRLLEGSTVTVNGSSLTLNNKRRSLSSKAPLATAFVGSTVTVDGTAIDTVLFGGGTNAGLAQSGVSRGEEEWVLAANTTYVIKLTANATANVSIAFDFYELS